jgi:non-ribosomal peptide synthetase component F
MTTALSFNLADMFESATDTFPERVALVSSQRRLSYGELEERATRLAND